MEGHTLRFGMEFRMFRICSKYRDFVKSQFLCGGNWKSSTGCLSELFSSRARLFEKMSLKVFRVFLCTELAFG